MVQSSAQCKLTWGSRWLYIKIYFVFFKVFVLLRPAVKYRPFESLSPLFLFWNYDYFVHVTKILKKKKRLYWIFKKNCSWGKSSLYEKHHLEGKKKKHHITRKIKLRRENSLLYEKHHHLGRKRLPHVSLEILLDITNGFHVAPTKNNKIEVLAVIWFPGRASTSYWRLSSDEQRATR